MNFLTYIIKWFFLYFNYHLIDVNIFLHKFDKNYDGLTYNNKKSIVFQDRWSTYYD